MKFTRDICRLLGIGGDGPGEDKMEVQEGTPAQTDRRKDQRPSQVTLNSEEGLDDEEKTRRRAERRRAKKKRQKERKKLEREERMEDASEQDEEAHGDVSESDSEEDGSKEAEEWTSARPRHSEEEQEEKGGRRREREEWTSVRPRHRATMEAVRQLGAAQSKRQLPHRASEEEPEWDVSSAFVAKAASHIKLKALKNRATHIFRENKENEARNSQVEVTEEMKRRGESLTVQGIQMFGQGLYSQAVDTFTEAIFCDPKDHRFYGNRSYCYWCLEQFSAALKDAHRSIQLAPDWPKGYFRKGCALMGMKRYGEAEKAMDQVLKLDPNCKEASSKLATCRLLQRMELGYEEEHGKLLLGKFTTVEAVITSKTLKHLSQQDSGSCRSLWVGNITLGVTEKDIRDLFEMFGEIESIRVLHERFCAFVNFKNANMAARALEKLQGVELGSSKLVMRYPDRWVQRALPTVHRTQQGPGSHPAGTPQGSAAPGPRGCAPINGDECFYWLTTGCFYGEKCCFKHLPQHQGRDKKP